MNDIFVICVNENDEHIDESILTNCCKCNRRVWISITNAAHKPICRFCVKVMSAIKENEVEFFITPESLSEAIKAVLKRKHK